MRRFLVLILFFSFIHDAMATGYAMIVGASQYKKLDERMWLEGPKYDAEMVADFLRRKKSALFSKENILVLADGVQGAQLPTKRAIQVGIDGIVKKAKEGDFVYLHFSGHGSRQPAKPGDLTETDGLDEMFLPSDIGPWQDAIGSVENALIDDEIGEMIGKIRQKGAFVWVVFDSCHSGTVTRGAPVGEDMKMRKVDPLALGIPQSALDEAEKNAPRTRGKAEEQLSPFAKAMGNMKNVGGFVAFYAAQSTEQTPEMRLPAGEEGRQPHGLFTFTILQTISEHPGITYRRAAQEVLQRYAALNMDRPTPLFEGDMDARVFGSAQVDEKPQWPIENRRGELHIPAGTLNRLNAGSIVAILKNPAAECKDAIGYAKVVRSETMDSVLQFVDYKGRKTLSLSALPENAYARVVEQKLDFSLRVARPEWSKEQPKELQDRLKKILSSLKPDDNTGLRLHWVDAGQPADLRLAFYVTEINKEGKRQTLDGDQIWFLPPTGDAVLTGASKTPSVTLKGKTDAQLQAALLDNMARIARVINLLRVSQGMGAGANALDVTLRIKRKSDGKFQDVPAEKIPQLNPGDEVHLLAVNNTKKPIDVNVLFVGSDYSISHWYKERIHPNGKLNAGLFRVNTDSIGKERVVVITNQAKPESELMDLSFLAQKALPKTRDRGPQGIGALLHDAGFGVETTRGVGPLGDSDDGGLSSILQFTVETLAFP